MTQEYAEGCFVSVAKEMVRETTAGHHFILGHELRSPGPRPAWDSSGKARSPPSLPNLIALQPQTLSP